MGICLFMAVGRLLKVKNSKFLRMILVTACGFLGGMVIYLADWGNYCSHVCIFYCSYYDLL